MRSAGGSRRSLRNFSWRDLGFSSFSSAKPSTGKRDVLDEVKFENALLRNGIFSVSTEDNLAQVSDEDLDGDGAAWEILSVYSCAECVLHEGSANREHRSTSSGSEDSASERAARGGRGRGSANTSYILATSCASLLDDMAPTLR
jgi:hypothetical protein